jgi:polar amino acid transport system substrate-binding protein
MRTNARWSVILFAASVSAAAAPDTVPLYLMTMPPLVIDDAARRGMVGDVVLEAMRRAGIQAKVLVEPNPRAMAMVQQGSDTYITALSRTPEREALYTWVAPLFAVQRRFYTLQRKVQSFEEAKAQLRRIAVSRNTANAEILRRYGFGAAQLVEVNAGESAPRMLLAGRVDAWFNLIPESETLLSQIGSPAVQRGAALAPTDLYLACSLRCDPAQVRKLAAAVAAMQADGTARRMMQKYSGEPGFAAD